MERDVLTKKIFNVTSKYQLSKNTFLVLFNLSCPLCITLIISKHNIPDKMLLLLENQAPRPN